MGALGVMHAVDHSPSIQNVLFSSYRLTFIKCQGNLNHSQNRYYRITKIILPKMSDIPFKPVSFNLNCSLLISNFSR